MRLFTLPLLLLHTVAFVLGSTNPTNPLNDIKLTSQQWNKLRSSGIMILPARGNSGLEIKIKKDSKLKFDDNIFNTLKPISQHIVALDLSNSKVTSEGLVNLKNFLYLKSLNLSGVKLDNSVINNLTECSKLEVVNLKNTAFSEEDLKMLKTKLPELKIILK